MKNRIYQMLSAGMVLAVLLSGCGSRPVPPTESTAQTQASDPTQMETEALRQKNDLVFRGGAMFTGMVPDVTEQYEDGTYRYEDLTEDRMTRIIQLSVANEGDPTDLEGYITRILQSRIDGDIRDLRILETADRSGGLVENESRLIYWVSGENEDTVQSVGVVTVTEYYTYLYCFRTPIDWFGEMEETWLDILNRLELVRI